jgi:hypothetical protein
MRLGARRGRCAQRSRARSADLAGRRRIAWLTSTWAYVAVNVNVLVKVVVEDKVTS